LIPLPLREVVAITGGVLHSPTGDDVSGTLALPFTVPYHGTNYSTIYVSTNGQANFLIGIAISKGPFGVLHGTPFHFVPGSHAVEMLGQQLRVRAGKVGQIHRRAHWEVFREVLED